MEKIVKISKIVKALIALLAFLHLVVVVFMAVDSRDSLAQTSASSSMTLNYKVESTWTSYAASLDDEGFNGPLIMNMVELIPYVLIYALLFKLFGLFQNAKIFEIENIRLIKFIGLCFLFWPALHLLAPNLITLVLRTAGFAENLPLHLALGSGDLKNLIIGAAITLIGHIFNEARLIQEEQELTI